MKTKKLYNNIKLKRINLKKKKNKILKLWQQNLKKIIKKPNNKIWWLHSGPTYANNLPHIGTIFNLLLKDTLTIFKQKLNYKTLLIPGWDMHGLPILNQALTNKEKKTLSNLKIRKKCQQFANIFLKKQKNLFRLFGINFLNNYTYNTDEINYKILELKILLKLLKQKKIYSNYLPIYYCLQCQTTLAYSEIKYQKKTNISLFLEFFNPQKKISCIIWTTTIWTLFSNKAIGYNKKYKYLLIKTPLKNFLIALFFKKEFLKYLKKKKITITKITEINNNFLQQTQLSFINPLNNIKVPLIENNFITNKGSGFLHIAPNHGINDFIIYKKYFPNKKLQENINEQGQINNVFYKILEKNLLNKIQHSTFFFQLKTIQHNFPICWRCKTETITKLSHQFFINLEKIVPLLKKKISNIKIIPNNNTFIKTINNRKNWCISRQRPWGIPLCSFKCKNCNHLFISKKIIKILIKKKNLEIIFNSQFSQYKIKCEKCKSHNLLNTQETLDVWFDSGISFLFFKQLLKKHFNFKRPTITFLEGNDQNKGWFQSSSFISLLLKKKLPFKTLITHGFIKKNTTIKFSKSEKKNEITLKEILSKNLEEYLRYFLLSKDFTKDIVLNKKIFSQNYKQFLRITRILLLLETLINTTQKYKKKLNKATNINNNSLFNKILINNFKINKNKIILELKTEKIYKILKILENFLINILSKFFLNRYKYNIKKKLVKNHHWNFITLLFLLKEILNLISPFLPFTSEIIFLRNKNYFKTSITSILFHTLTIKKEKISIKLKKIFQELCLLKKKIKEKTHFTITLNYKTKNIKIEELLKDFFLNKKINFLYKKQSFLKLNQKFFLYKNN